MFEWSRTGFAFSTTNISAGRNSSALAGPPTVCFNKVNIFRQHRTIQSNFSCGDWNESMATSSVMALYTRSRTSAFTSSMLHTRCLALIQLSCRIRFCILESLSSSVVNGGENKILKKLSKLLTFYYSIKKEGRWFLLVIFCHDTLFEKIHNLIPYLRLDSLEI